MMNYYDETMEHIYEVQRNLMVIASELEIRGKNHDESKLNPPESIGFSRLTPKLKESTYGSDEYKSFLKELGPVLEHHYAKNRHHPEFHDKGINGMTLIDVVELFCDWLSAAKRHNDGNVYKSIEINKERFGMSQQLTDIFINTAKIMEGGK